MENTVEAQEFQDENTIAKEEFSKCLQSVYETLLQFKKQNKASGEVRMSDIVSATSSFIELKKSLFSEEDFDFDDEDDENN